MAYDLSDDDKAAAYAADMEARLGFPVAPAENLEGLVRDSDIVVTTTPSREPLIHADWLHPGLHITAMGSDIEYKNELAPAVLAAADLYVPDRLAQCAVLGELRHAIAGWHVEGPFLSSEPGSPTGRSPRSTPSPATCALSSTPRRRWTCRSA